jgi:DNA-binding transcriptional regulator GbsR (MarR family)
MKMIAHIHLVKYSWEKEGRFELYSAKLDDAEFRTYVCSQEIEIDVPADYDPRAQQIAALEKQKQEAMADFQKSVDDINERISKLQALEYTA